LKVFTTENPENQISEEQRASFQKYGEQGFGFRPFPEFGQQNTCLSGYFQSPQYFAPVQSTIYQLIRLSDKKRDVQQKYPLYFTEGKTRVSMHVRMGDYKSKRYYHPIMNYEYFEAALQHIVTRVHLLMGFVFSIYASEKTMILLGGIFAGFKKSIRRSSSRKSMTRFPIMNSSLLCRAVLTILWRIAPLVGGGHISTRIPTKLCVILRSGLGNIMNTLMILTQ
jgi:hypothetical protein